MVTVWPSEVTASMDRAYVQLPRRAEKNMACAVLSEGAGVITAAVHGTHAPSIDGIPLVG